LEYPHQPVLVQAVVDHLLSDRAGIYVDGTVGSGGHSEAIGRRLSEKGRLICLDRDPQAVRLSRERLSFLGPRVVVERGNYADFDRTLYHLGLRSVDGVLLDLGMSAYQLEKSGRGFSFQRDEPLDMRMDADGELTARQLVNELPEDELERILRKYGEEKRARTIARAIGKTRRRQPIETSYQLAHLIRSVSSRRRNQTKDPATRSFQALRIAVNKELQNLEIFLAKVPFWVAKGGRVAILSYHSLEDRLIKQTMVEWEKTCTCPPGLPQCVCGKVSLFSRPFKRGLRPGRTEIAENPGARSALLRVAERV
jgi:16S rRNA (cytosine1402-N4)-methyltransferase